MYSYSVSSSFYIQKSCMKTFLFYICYISSYRVRALFEPSVLKCLMILKAHFYTQPINTLTKRTLLFFDFQWN